MDTDDIDIFDTTSTDATSSNIESNSGQSHSLYKIINTGDGKSKSESSQSLKNEEEARKKAAQSRLSKQRSAVSDTQYYVDNDDLEDRENDPEYLLDIGSMGTKQGDRFVPRSKNIVDDQLIDDEESGRFEPLNMRNELRRGEIDQYGMMTTKRSKRRNKDENEENPNELAMPPSSSSGKSKNKKKRKRTEFDEDEFSTSSEEEEDYNDEEENEDLNNEDAWLSEISKKGEEAIYHKKTSEETKNKKDTSNQKKNEDAIQNKTIDPITALNGLAELLRTGPHNETVLKLIKRLSPSSSAQRPKQKKQKTIEAESNNSMETTEASVDAKDISIIEKKKRFDDAVSFADILMDEGFTLVHQATLDEILAKLEEVTKKSKSKNVTKSTNNSKQTSEEKVEQGEEGTQWQYKWKQDDSEVFGPFDVQSMKSWSSMFIQFPDLVVRPISSSASNKMVEGQWQKYEASKWA